MAQKLTKGICDERKATIIMRVNHEFSDLVSQIAKEEQIPKTAITRKIAKKIRGDDDNRQSFLFRI